MSTEQFETDREREAVGPDHYECSLCGLDEQACTCFDRDDEAEQKEKDQLFESLLRAEEKRQREAVKKLCLAGLIALGIVPRSLVCERHETE